MSQYAACKTGTENERMEKKQTPAYGILYLYGIEYGRVLNTNR